MVANQNRIWNSENIPMVRINVMKQRRNRAHRELPIQKRSQDIGTGRHERRANRHTARPNQLAETLGNASTDGKRLAGS